jgi:hypothetical protein
MKHSIRERENLAGTDGLAGAEPTSASTMRLPRPSNLSDLSRGTEKARAPERASAAHCRETAPRS